MFTPSTGHLLSPEQWSAIRSLSLGASRFDVAGLQLPPDLAPAAPILRTLQADATEFNGKTLPRAISMGASLVEYGRDSIQKFDAIITLLDNSDANAGIVLQHLDDLQVRATASAAAAVNVFASLVDYSNKATASLSALDAVVKGSRNFSSLGDLESAKAHVERLTAQIEEETRERAKFGPNDPGWEIIGIQLDNSVFARDALDALIHVKSLHVELGTQLAAAMPGLQHTQGAWNAIAMELQAVAAFAKKAGAAALKDVPCLARVELSTAASEWQVVADDAQNFVETYRKAASA